MSRTYKATGINLKGMPLGETDRLLTLLTPEYGIVRAVAPGARKQKSQLRGRSELFVINDLLIVKGRSLDRITQAETLESYPGLSRELGKLAASQYLGELVLGVGLSEQPQVELYELLNEHLRRLEQLPKDTIVLGHLCQAVFHILALVGLGIQVHGCIVTQQVVKPDWRDPQWRIGFSLDGGGIVQTSTRVPRLEENPPLKVNMHLSAVELTLLQQLSARTLPPFSELPELSQAQINRAWEKIERLLREMITYHLGRSIRSASFLETLSGSPQF
jgi:DNA repair protein RecO (recombination protein O)